MTAVAAIVDNDAVLFTLYSLLVLASPAREAVPSVRILLWDRSSLSSELRPGDNVLQCVTWHGSHSNNNSGKAQGIQILLLTLFQ